MLRKLEPNVKAIALAYLAVLLTALGLLIYSGIDFYSLRNTQENSIVSLNSDWEYVSDGASTKCELPFIYNNGTDNEIVLARVLPALEEDVLLCVNTNQLDVAVYIDGEPIYATGQEPNTIFGQVIRLAWNRIALPSDSGGKTIELHLNAPYGGTQLDMYSCILGTTNAATFMFIDGGFPAMLISFFQVVTSMFLLGVVALLKKRLGKRSTISYGYLVGFVVLAAFWVVTDNDSLQFFVKDIPVLYFTSYFSFMLMPVPFLLYIRDLCSRGKAVFNLLCAADVVCIAVSLILMMTGVGDLAQTIILTHIMMAASVVCTILICRMEYKKYGNRDMREIQRGVMVMSTVIVVGLVLYYTGAVNDTSFIVQYGVPAFVLLICFGGFRRIMSLVLTASNFQELAATVSGGICRIGNDEKFTLKFANSFYYEMLGYTELEALFAGFDCASYAMYPEDIPKLREAVERARLSKQPCFEAEVRHFTKDGEQVWILLRCRLDLDSGAEFTAVVIDVSELVSMRMEAEAANKSKADFLANMSHEIRTPMNAICGMAELLQNSELMPLEKGYVKTIQSASGSLLGIINDILDFSKIDAQKMELVEHEYEFAELITETQEIIGPRASGKGLSFVVEVDKDTPVRLYGDKTRVKQILINLLGNAVKFTAKGSITLSVNCKRGKDNEIWLDFAVKDTGIGIKEEDISKLFSKFSQVDTKRNRAIEGTGLGLALSQSLAELMRGTVTVQSAYGTGSTFTATVMQRDTQGGALCELAAADKYQAMVLESNELLKDALTKMLEDIGVQMISSPLERDGDKHCLLLYDCLEHGEAVEGLDGDRTMFRIAMMEYGDVVERENSEVTYVRKPVSLISLIPYLGGAPVHAAHEKEVRRTLSAPDARVMVVDDNELNLKVASGLLKHFDIRAKLVVSGLAAIECVNSEPCYDLIFMDHMMPGMDGVETTARIRAMDSAYARSVPIVALTANAIKGVEEEFYTAGMNACVFKPVRLDVLEETLDKWLPADKKRYWNRITVEHEPMPVIDGLDVASAVELAGGVSNFMNVLSDYAASVEAKAAMIEECLASGDIERFVIEVHSLKSISRVIGAEEVGELAARLERCGRDGDIDAMKRDTPELLTQYRALGDKLAPYIQEEEIPDSQKHEISDEELMFMLCDIKYCLEEFDLNGAERVMKELECCLISSEMSAGMRRLSGAVKDIDYDNGVFESEQMIAMLV